LNSLNMPSRGPVSLLCFLGLKTWEMLPMI
jgi:hypothetical protein